MFVSCATWGRPVVPCYVWANQWTPAFNNGKFLTFHLIVLRNDLLTLKVETLTGPICSQQADWQISSTAPIQHNDHEHTAAA